MRFSPELAEKRFGCGLSPVVDGPGSVADMLNGVHTPDAMAEAFPIEGFQAVRTRTIEFKAIRKAMKESRGTDSFADHEEALKALKRRAREAQSDWLINTALRWTRTATPFRERLAVFWADHFTARGKDAPVKWAMSSYIETGIRPNLAGQFEDLLFSAVTHPMMLMYLDQTRSVGPGSKVGVKSKGKRGLNENLARELLELHTLGVDGAYAQSDVRELAELLTGLHYTPQRGMFFAPNRAEPGAETVLGHSYGGEPATLESVRKMLRDLARHPDTARHIARKLAVHFVSDSPPANLVQAMIDVYQATGGDLTALYGVMLEHPDSWATELRNVKPPFDFIASACRAIAVEPARLSKLKQKDIRTLFKNPLHLMGQPWQAPPGPDGWPEEDDAWITPQGLAARVRWAMVVPANLRRDLPDPREFAKIALGKDVPQSVQFATRAAERRMDGVGLVLASPAFQRR